MQLFSDRRVGGFIHNIAMGTRSTTHTHTCIPIPLTIDCTTGKYLPKYQTH